MPAKIRIPDEGGGLHCQGQPPMITAAQFGLLMPCACGATPMVPCRGAGIDADTLMHADRVEAGLQAAAELLGMPPRSTAAVASLLRHGAAKHGATPTTSSADQSPLDHYRALLRRAARIQRAIDGREVSC